MQLEYPPPHPKIKSLEKCYVHVFKNVWTGLQEYDLQSALLSSHIQWFKYYYLLNY